VARNPLTLTLGCYRGNEGMGIGGPLPHG